jgi:hypothetical protein
MTAVSSKKDARSPKTTAKGNWSRGTSTKMQSNRDKMTADRAEEEAGRSKTVAAGAK